MERRELQRTSGIDRILLASPEEEVEFLEYFRKRFEDQEKELNEREKTPEETRMIQDILARLEGFVQQYGGNAPSFTPDHVHFLDIDQLDEETRKRLNKQDTAFYNPARQRTIVLSAGTLLRKAGALTHELLHASSFGSFIKRGDEITVRRGGLSAVGRKDEQLHKDERLLLGGLNEAIIEELNKRFDAQNFEKIPELTHDLDIRSHFRALVKAQNPELDLQDAAWMGEIDLPEGKHGVEVRSYGYREQRQMLNNLIDTLYEQNRSTFQDREEVFSVFARAALTGNMLEAGRLVDNTLGKGSFKKLGESTSKKIDLWETTDAA